MANSEKWQEFIEIVARLREISSVNSKKGW